VSWVETCSPKVKAILLRVGEVVAYLYVPAGVPTHDLGFRQNFITQDTVILLRYEVKFPGKVPEATVAQAKPELSRDGHD
jgi:hypothetical protein